MRNVTYNEMRLVAAILKGPEVHYTANALGRHLDISPMGAWKIAQKLKKEGIIEVEQVGNAHVFKINLANEYALNYMRFVLAQEAESAHPYVKRWVTELKKLNHADLVILFGSVLRKHAEANDVDALIVIDEKSFNAVKKEVERINRLNDKKIHPVYQTKEDLQKHLKEKQAVVLNAIKGIVVSGESVLLEALRK